MLCELGYGLHQRSRRGTTSVKIKSFNFSASLPLEFTYTRSGVQTVRNSSGEWVSVVTNTAPFDHTAAGVALGLRFEPV